MVFLGIHCDDWDEALKAAKDDPIEYPITNDTGEKSQEAYDIQGYPTLIVIDKTGVVRDIDPIDLEASIEKLLNE